MRHAEGYQALRSALDTGLAVAEGAGVPFDEAVVEVIKGTVATSLVVSGPAPTIAGLRQMADQLEAELVGRDRRKAN